MVRSRRDGEKMRSKEEGFGQSGGGRRPVYHYLMYNSDKYWEPVSWL